MLLLIFPFCIVSPVAIGPTVPRELDIFAPSVHDPAFRRQMALLSPARKALLERDIQIVLIFDHASGDDLVPYNSDSLYLLLNSRDEAEIRRDLHVLRGKFTILLIGKDGGEKLRRRTPVTLQQLDDLIDSMPMRQQEMRERLPRQ